MSAPPVPGRGRHAAFAATAFCAFFIREGFALPVGWQIACTAIMIAGSLWLAGSRLREARHGGAGRGAGAYAALLVATQLLHAVIGGSFTVLGAVEAFVGMEGFLLVLLLGHAIGALRLSPAQAMIGGFALLIALGTLLLWLPRSGRQPLGLVDALFHATSAVCVTGLTTLDPGTELTPLGQGILLLLIQIGGIGIMTVAFFALTAGKDSLGLREQAMVRDLLPSEGRSVGESLFWIMVLALGLEAIGALALYAAGDAGPERPAAFTVVFHAVSAFCNAGFSLHRDSLASVSAPALAVYGGLIVLGGLGFTVLLELARKAADAARRLRGHGIPPERRGFSVHARLVLWSSAILVVAGAAVLLLVESSNPATLGGMPLGQRVLHATFQSITARTAGFSTIDPAAMREPSLALTYALMCIGASPGSTGGGIKTVVVAVAFLSVLAVLRRRPAVTLFRRSLPADLTLKAAALVSVYGASLWLVSFALMLCAGPAVAFRDLSFEAASAMGTVGLSTGITPALPASARLVLCAAMFLGRLGPLAFLVFWSRQAHPPRVEFPSGRVHLG